MGRHQRRRVPRAARRGRPMRPWVAALAGGLAIGAGVLGFWAPASRPAEGQPGAPSGVVRAHPGRAVYEKHCATCHGPAGGSDGPGASALPIKPPPFTDGRLLNPLPDDFLYTVVRDGAAAVGLAPQMPAFGRLLTDREIRDVVAYVRTLAQPPYRPPPGPAPRRSPRRPRSRSSSATRSTRGRTGSTASSATPARAGARSPACHPSPAAWAATRSSRPRATPRSRSSTSTGTGRKPSPGCASTSWRASSTSPTSGTCRPISPCQTCHGRVEAMQRVAQVAPLTMGWCVACHAERRGPLDCVACHH